MKGAPTKPNTVDALPTCGTHHSASPQLQKEDRGQTRASAEIGTGKRLDQAT